MLVNNGLKVTKAWFIETGTAPDMVSRNFTTHVTPEAVHQFAERTRGGELITEDNLAGVAGTIIQPDANFERQVAIANGWSNPRYRFLLRVANPETPNGVVYYYSGYTDTPTGVLFQTTLHQTCECISTTLFRSMSQCVIRQQVQYLM